MSIKHDDTSELIERWVKTINNKLPINISFLSEPITSAITDRIKTLETIYGRSRLYQFLIRKGVYPIVLFTTISSALTYSAHRAYSRSTQFVIHLVGVLYPTYCCWKLVKATNQHQDEQLQSWLTYWMIFGSFQVLDHWMNSDLFMFSRKKYNLYKLLVLYWAQNPHSRGAYLLYKYVIQKPVEEEEEPEEETRPAYIEQEKKESYRLIDGYTPPNIQNQSNSSVSSDDDSIGSHHHTEEDQSIHITLSSQKETYPLLMNTAEAAW